MLPVPVEMLALPSQPRPLVSQVLGWLATILGSKHKVSLEEIDIAVKEQASLLKHLAINVALPGQSRAIGVDELMNVLKSWPPLCPCKKVEKQENQKALLVIMVNTGSVF